MSEAMTVLDLSGAWQLRRADQSDTIPAHVPGCVHTDLMAAGAIDDPFPRDNETRVQWVGEAGWVYSRRFTVPPDLLAHEHVLLRCHGLDTLSAICVNGAQIAATDNMFRTWEFDIRSALHAGENEIGVHFSSPLPLMRQRQQERPLPSWGGPHEPKGRAWIRKEPCNFGWDWGPVLITCGIWRPIELVAYDTARITDVRIAQQHSPGEVRLTVEVATDREQRLEAVVGVALDGRAVGQVTVPVIGGQATADLTLTDPQLWWPNGMGEQPLYRVTVELRDGSGVLDSASRRIGLRSLRLDRHADRWGESFQFVVNDVPFFAKGANWIPADAFVTRLTRADYERLLSDAADANMNMLRVWGGGIYEDDAFYDLCDELGICVWQDFMFACSTYPTFDADFMSNVEAEAEDNVRRLRHHPCIALWCGNNELEQGLVGDGWTDTHMSWQDYSALFDMLLPEVVRRLDPQRDYWPCSPHTPHGDRTDFNNPTCGDAHLWSVWHGLKPFEWYYTCDHRFNSEFGFQSFPEPRTVRGYTAPDDRNVTSYVMEHHQRSGIGNSTIMHYMLDWFRLPTSFEMTLWLSQILQGMAIKYAVEHWRRSMPRGMGTLYWQLNDCWPVASWSSVDYHGRWKALHYMARRFFAPLLLSAQEDAQTGRVAVHVTSDLSQPPDVGVAWTLTDLDGAVLDGGSVQANAPAHMDSLVASLDVSSHIARHGRRSLLLWLDLADESDLVSSDVVLFARPKHLDLRDPVIRADVTETAAGAFEVTLSVRRPALWGWLSLQGADARLSDNFVHLRPGRPVTLTLIPAAPMTISDVRAELRVATVRDTYQEYARAGDASLTRVPQ